MAKKVVKVRASIEVLRRWAHLLEDEPPRFMDSPILYHYTDSVGVHGILTSNSLWATATQFSNDLSELDYAAAIANQVTEELWGDRKFNNPWERFLVEHVRLLFATPLHVFGQSFIVSFCENGDLLSQWRAYGPRGGFSLAFKELYKSEEIALDAEHGFRTLLTKVMYEPSEQRKRLLFLLKNFMKLVQRFEFSVDSKKGHDAHRELGIILPLEMTNWATVVKHESFSEEQEWRITTYPINATFRRGEKDFRGVHVRPTSKLLLPYMVLKPRRSKRLPVTGIRCGPGHFQDQCERALRILARNQGYKDVEITGSGAPLRL